VQTPHSNEELFFTNMLKLLDHLTSKKRDHLPEKLTEAIARFLRRMQMFNAVYVLVRSRDLGEETKVKIPVIKKSSAARRTVLILSRFDTVLKYLH